MKPKKIKYTRNGDRSLSLSKCNRSTSPTGDRPLSEVEVPLNNWIDSQDVMQLLHISPRTLHTLRTNGTLPYSRIGYKFYYRKQDIQKILSDNYIMSKLNKE